MPCAKSYMYLAEGSKYIVSGVPGVRPFCAVYACYGRVAAPSMGEEAGGSRGWSRAKAAARSPSVRGGGDAPCCDISALSAFFLVGAEPFLNVIVVIVNCHLGVGISLLLLGFVLQSGLLWPSNLAQLRDQTGGRIRDQHLIGPGTSAAVSHDQELSSRDRRRPDLSAAGARRRSL